MCAAPTEQRQSNVLATSNLADCAAWQPFQAQGHGVGRLMLVAQDADPMSSNVLPLPGRPASAIRRQHRTTR